MEAIIKKIFDVHNSHVGTPIVVTKQIDITIDDGDVGLS